MKVLVIDSDAVSARRILEALQVDGAHARTPAEAFSRLLTGDYDLVVTEYHLEGIDGLKLFSAIRMLCDAPVAVYSLESSEEVVVSCLECGAAGYFLKADGERVAAETMRELLS